ncbi:MAG TPA: hypothetical protein PL074_09235 [Thermoflexales bacterium]|nr:hypothetical protein [Thermoflexales bacterium]
MKNDKPMNSLNEGMDMWMEYAKAYTDFVVGMNQNAMKAMVDAREQFDKAMSETMNKSMALGQKEQQMASDMMSAFQNQAQKMWDANTKLFENALDSGKAMTNQLTSMMDNASATTRAMTEKMAAAMDPNKK